jgi:HAMP domain-containing protein
MKRGFTFVNRVCASLLMLSTAGCIRVTPKMPKTLSLAAPITYVQKDFEQDVSDYHTSVKAGTPASLDLARTQRNQIVFRVLAQIDAAYFRFETGLATTRAGAQTLADGANLGVTAAATVVGASSVKDILSATSVALQGTRLSFDKNFFEEKTTESLISQMRATRKNLNAQMLDSLAKRDVASYPLEAAWSDVVAYYYAGTIPSALVDLASKTGAEATKADANLKDKVAELTLAAATPAEAKQAINVRDEFEALAKAVASQDPSSVKKAEATLRDILASAGTPAASSATPDELLDAVKSAMIAATTDAAKRKKLLDAFQTALAKND